jgi:hypothetical protein
VCRSYLDDFLLVFNNVETLYQVLHTPLPEGAMLNLHFRHWLRQSRALFKPLRYKVPSTTSRHTFGCASSCKK